MDWTSGILIAFAMVAASVWVVGGAVFAADICHHITTVGGIKYNGRRLVLVFALCGPAVWLGFGIGIGAIKLSRAAKRYLQGGGE